MIRMPARGSLQAGSKDLVPCESNSGESCGRRAIPEKRSGACLQAQLQKRGVTATVRRTLGEDIDAACGQLRRKMEADQSANL